VRDQSLPAGERTSPPHLLAALSSADAA